MKKNLFKALYFLRAYQTSRLLPGDTSLILTYHGFTDKETHRGIENHQGKHVFILKFEKQIRFLKENYNLISLKEWILSCKKGIKIPKRSVILTMDDGYRSNYTLAFPVLKKYNAPATLFLSTNFVENRIPLWPDRLEYLLDNAEQEAAFRSKMKQMSQALREQTLEELEKKKGRSLDFQNEIPAIYQPLQWPEVLEMLKSGLVSVGSHTHTHAILTRCSAEEMEIELRFSKKIIEERTGEPCHLFCYPNGGPGDFDARTKNFLQEAGYECALTTIEGFNTLQSDFFKLKRLGVRNQTDQAEFAMTICGFKNVLSRAKTMLSSEKKSEREQAWIS